MGKYFNRPETSGENHYNRKLTNNSVIQIFRRLQQGEKQEALALEFRVSQKTISAIKCGKRWQHLNLLKDKNDG